MSPSISKFKAPIFLLNNYWFSSFDPNSPSKNIFSTPNHSLKTSPPNFKNNSPSFFLFYWLFLTSFYLGKLSSHNTTDSWSQLGGLHPSYIALSYHRWHASKVWSYPSNLYLSLLQPTHTHQMITCSQNQNLKPKHFYTWLLNTHCPHLLSIPLPIKPWKIPSRDKPWLMISMPSLKIVYGIRFLIILNKKLWDARGFTRSNIIQMRTFLDTKKDWLLCASTKGSSWTTLTHQT